MARDPEKFKLTSEQRAELKKLIEEDTALKEYELQLQEKYNSLLSECRSMMANLNEDNRKARTRRRVRKAHLEAVVSAHRGQDPGAGPSQRSPPN